MSVSLPAFGLAVHHANLLKYNVTVYVFQVTQAFPASQDHKVILDQLDFRDTQDTQAVRVIWVFREFQEIKAIREFQVQTVSQAPLEQPVKYFMIVLTEWLPCWTQAQ